MRHVLKTSFPAIVLVNLLFSQAHLFAQSIPEVPDPICAYCKTPISKGTHLPGCPYYQSPTKPAGSKPSGYKPGPSSPDVNAMVAGALFQSLLTSMFTTSNAPNEAEVQAAKQKAIMLAAQQAAMKKAKEAAARAEHEKMMKSYKQLEGAQGAGFKTLSDSSLNFKTLDGDMEALSAGARKPFDTPSEVNVPGSAAIAGGTPFFGDTMPVETIQFLVQPENDPNVVDLRDAQTYVVENLKKDSNDLEAAVKRYEDKADGEPIVHRPDCVALARKLNGLIRQRQQFQKTIDLAQEQLTTWETANRNALLNAAKDGLDWYTGHLLDISKIAASNKVFGKWVARKVPIIAGVELAINETYNALDWYLSYKQIREANKINGHVLDAARQLQRNIDDTYLALRECP